MYDNIILIPYRNRKTHLDYYIKNTLPLLKEYLPNSKVIVIEQCNDKLFNRGKVLNVGFKEYSEKTKYFITNDIDINPSKKTILEYYLPDIESNIVRGIFTSSCNTLGGIIKISSLNIKNINGFPNNIWGWGCEDKALQNRAEYYNIIKETNHIQERKTLNNDYFVSFDDIKDNYSPYNLKRTSFYYHIFKKLKKKDKLKKILESGLNNIDYKILERENINEYIEIIKVDI